MVSAPKVELIAVDWGTTNFRAYSISSAGKIIERIETASGISSVAAGTFPTVLRDQLAKWLPSSVPVIVSGMAGSQQGWVEVPYAACPADASAIARGIVRQQADGFDDVLLVPGLKCRGTDGQPDVMRGEETQIIGALDEKPTRVCLPGTHSKWATCEGGVVTGFATYMTGETFDVLSKHSILARTIGQGALDDAAFAQGIAQAKSGALLHHLFGVRARGLIDGLTPLGQRSLLSGLLIGHEVEAALGDVPADAVPTVIGAPALTYLYSKALKLAGRPCHIVDGASAVARGAWRLARLWRETAKGR